MNIMKLIQACLFLANISIPVGWCYESETNQNQNKFFETDCNVIGVCKVKSDLSTIP